MPASPVATETLFARACRGQPTEHVPVWLMRQAGRYLPAYQELKRDASFWDLCSKPELSAKATLDAVTYLGADAAIIFSDITVIGKAMGLPLVFEPGPVFQRPVRTTAEVAALSTIHPERDLDYVLEAIRLTRARLAAPLSLIGFCGAPFTLAAYMIEGVPGKNWLETKRLLYGEPKVAAALIDKVTDAIVAHAIAQVEAGCDVIQLFDSNAGELAPAELERFALAPARRAVAAIKRTGVPVIYFARNVGAELARVATVAADVLGLDWQVDVASARQVVGSRQVLQGNLDPAVLLTNANEIERRVNAILEQAYATQQDRIAGHAGFVFNLGHGVLPATPPEHARQVVQVVQRWRPGSN